MQVRLTEEGTLVVSGDNGCERFALREWAQQHTPGVNLGNGVCLLKIADVDVVKAPPTADAERLDRAERALKRAGYTYLEGAAEWKPPVGRARSRGDMYRHRASGTSVEWVSDSVRVEDGLPLATYWVMESGRAYTRSREDFEREFARA